jgi:hypothetical protein
VSPEPFLVYDPPDGGQVVRVRRPADAWERPVGFLRTCTDADPLRPQHASLTLFEPRAIDQAAWYAPTLAAAEAAFGAGERRAWTAGAREDFCVEWHLSWDASERARAFLEAGWPWPKTEFGPLEVTLSYTFRWVDPETRAVLPGQTADRRAHRIQATSDLLLTLGRPSSLILTGRFPFAEPGAEFIAYLERVVPHMPMPVLASRFRRWLPTRRPTKLGYTVRRVESGLLDGVVR